MGDQAFHQGRQEEAARHYSLAVDAARAAHGPELAAALNSLAAVERLEGRYDKAAGLYRQSAASLEKFVGADPVELRTLYYDLAQVLSLAGKLKEADEAYGRFSDLAVGGAVAGGSELADELVEAGQYFDLQRDHIAATKCYARALTIRERLLPPGSAAITELQEDIEAAKKSIRDEGAAPRP